MAKKSKAFYKEEYRKYHSSPEKIKERSNRNKARRLMIKTKGKKAVQGKEVDHADGNPMNNNRRNLQIMSRHKNRVKQ
jgi:hypothetical protein